MLSPIVCLPCCIIFFFFFNDTATTEIYTLSLHDALPILSRARPGSATPDGQRGGCGRGAMAGAAGIAMRGPLGFHRAAHGDRKSTRLNSSHDQISYAVFCLKKKTKSQPRRSGLIVRATLA